MSNFTRQLKRKNKRKMAEQNHCFPKFDYKKEEVLGLVHPEYHSLLFMKLAKNIASQAEKIKSDIHKMHTSYFEEKLKGNELDGETAYELVFSYGDFLENKMYDILKHHSVGYWLHLYRRIGLGTGINIGRKEDTHTLSLIRRIVETAIVKYGNFISTDISDSRGIDKQKVLGGLFVKYTTELLGDNADKFMEMSLKKNVQVMTEFSEEDYVNMYVLEALSYEYWWVTAALRSIGKGASIYLQGNGIVGEKRNNTLQLLIKNYDYRISAVPFNTSNLGISFHDTTESLSMPTPYYNAERLNITEINPYFKCSKIELVTNFGWAGIDSFSYIEAHKFIDKNFYKKFGFSMTDLVLFVTAVSIMGFGNSFDTAKEKPMLISHVSLYQRAYILYQDIATFKDYLRNFYQNLSKEHANYEDAEKSIDAITDFLTLEESKQSNVSLWSFGPQFLFIPCGDMLLINFVAIDKLLENLFYRVSFKQDQKGPIFEDNFREYIKSNGLDLLNFRQLVSLDGKEREVDAAVRIENKLFLLECRAIERPLDFEISKIKTMGYRNSELETKLDQAISLEKFIGANKKGKNYDFDWAIEIVPIAVTAFVEWIPSLDEKYWIEQGKIPRILSAYEAVEYMKRVQSVSV